MRNKPFYTFFVICDVISFDVGIRFWCGINLFLCRQSNHKMKAMQNGKGGWGQCTHTCTHPSYCRGGDAMCALATEPLPCHAEYSGREKEGDL